MTSRKIVIPADSTCTVTLDALIPADEQIELIRQILSKQRCLELSIFGSCMRPWIGSGDRITVRPLERPARTGMVVLAQKADSLAAHRVVRVTREGLVVARGDLSRVPDDPVPSSFVLGQVVRVRGRFGASIPLDNAWLQQLGLRGAPLLRVLRAALRKVRRRR